MRSAWILPCTAYDFKTRLFTALQPSLGRKSESLPRETPERPAHQVHLPLKAAASRAHHQMHAHREAFDEAEFPILPFDHQPVNFPARLHSRYPALNQRNCRHSRSRMRAR
jgi:hypothetical protein